MPYKSLQELAYHADYRAAHRKENKAYCAAYSASHREEKKARNAAYQAAHVGELKAHKAAYRSTHRKELKDREATYHAAHPEKRKAYGIAYRATHREELKARSSAYYVAHRKEAKAHRTAYRATHPEVHRTAKARRQARRKGLPATLTVEQWVAILAAYKHRCAYCGKKSNDLTQDHVIPVARGGGTTPDNIVPACLSCNCRKRAGPPPSIPGIRLLI